MATSSWKQIKAEVYSDSIFKYLRTEDGVSVDLKLIRGGTIRDIQQIVRKTSEPDVVVVHVGTNDLTDPRTTMTGLERDYRQLLETLTYIYHCPIVISGILPRTDRVDLEPLRVAANLLLGCLTSEGEVDRSSQLSFHSWDEETKDFHFFSIDGLHPSKRGNQILHDALRSHLQWMLSTEREVSNYLVGRMISLELARTRSQEKERIQEKMAKRTKSRRRQFERVSGHIPEQSVRHGRVETHQASRVLRLRDLPLSVSLLAVADMIVLCPTLTGWGRHSAQKVAKDQPLFLPKMSRPSKPKPCEKITCPLCPVSVLTDDSLLDHFLQAHQEECAIDNYVQEDLLDCLRVSGGGYKEKTRGECEYIHFSEAKYSVKQVKQVTDDLVEVFFTEVSECSLLPPLEQLNNLKVMLAKFEEKKGTPCYIEFVSGSKFRMKEVNEALEYYHFKNIGQCVFNEKKWLKTSEDIIVTETPLSPSILDEFSNIIFKNTPNQTVNVNGMTLSVEDLVSLTQTQWLTNFLCMSYIEKFNRLSDSSKAIFLLDLGSIPQAVQRHLRKVNCTNQLIFNFLIQSKGSKTFCTGSGNHFVFTVYQVKENKLIYADPLGGNIPEGFLDQFKTALEACGVDSKSLVVTYCHNPESRSINGPHICNSSCSKSYPLQTCGSICGIAAIVGFTLAAFRPDLFNEMLKTKPNLDVIFPLTYLRNVSAYSSFLRKVVIHWLISPSIDISLLFKQKPLISTLGLKDICIPSFEQNRALLKKQMTDEVREITQNSKGLDTENSDKLVSVLKTNNKERPKLYKQYKLDYDVNLLNMLSCKPTVYFKSKEKKLVLTLSPKNCKSKIYKNFPCQDGLNDHPSIGQINSFLHSNECMLKVKSLANSITTVYNIYTESLRSESDDMFKFIQSVNAGDKLKDYFDTFTFDTRKDFRLSRRVNANYLENGKIVTISVTDNPKWGKTHRLDETYEFSGDKPIVTERVVTLTVQCSGKTTECRASCGNLISNLHVNTENEVPCCSGCAIPLTNVKTCSNCKINDSPQWYTYQSKEASTSSLHGQIMCSNCYRYVLKNKTRRPDHLIKTCKKRAKIHNSHFQCGWMLKCYIYSDNLNSWQVHGHIKNNEYHPNTPSQLHKRPCLSDRDNIDKMRSFNKTTPNQINLSFQRKEEIHIGDKDNSRSKQLRELISKDQIKNRIKTVDYHEIRKHVKKLDENPLTGSDWRNSEKVLENHSNSVLFFQRGFKQLNRHYHFVLSNYENLTSLQMFGKYLIGYDNKYDLTAVRFPVGLVTVCDSNNKGKAVAISMSNSDEAQVHALTIKLLLFNVPCEDSNCDHKQELRVFSDGNGFFRFRPCSLVNPLSPMVQHDKDSSIKAAVSSIGLKSSLCNFHALQAFRRHVHEDSMLRMFIRPLETGLKTVMRAWSPDSRNALVENYFRVINIIPSNLLSDDQKQKFINYLKKNWFECIWSETFTSEVLYNQPVQERRNPLILTDNVTERKFRDIDESVFNSHLNKSVTILVIKMIDMFLYFEGKKTAQASSYRRANITSMEKERNCAERGISIVNRLVYDQEWIRHGWFAIAFEDNQLRTVPSEPIDSLPDAHFVGCESEAIAEAEIVFSQIPSSNSCDLFKLSKQIDDEHSYDIQSKCKKILSKLEYELVSSWHHQLISHLPQEVKNALHNINDYQYICNINMGVCSCYAFICRGPPYFCKHLYAGLSLLKKLNEPRELVSEYQQYNTSFRTVISETFPETNISKSTLEKSLTELNLISRVASKEEVTNKSFLKLLHDKPIVIKSFTGSLAKRQPHNLGNRRKGGPIKEGKYSLVNPVIIDDSNSVLDPYRPNVTFPDRAKERHGGRKRNRPAGRGVNFGNMIKTALDILGHKLKDTPPTNMACDDTSDHFSDGDSADMRTHIPPKPPVDINNANKTFKTPTTSSSRVQSAKRLMLCKLCITNQNPKPFSCSSKQELALHTYDVHSNNAIICVDCYEQSGILIEHQNVADFNHHLRDVHSTKSPVQFQKKEAKLKSSSLDAKKSKLSVSLKRKSNTPNLGQIPTKLARWPCPLCLKECSGSPPSICCDSCELWYHFKCVGISQTPESDHWYCLTCKTRHKAEK